MSQNERKQKPIQIKIAKGENFFLHTQHKKAWTGDVK